MSPPDRQLRTYSRVLAVALGCAIVQLVGMALPFAETGVSANAWMLVLLVLVMARVAAIVSLRSELAPYLGPDAARRALLVASLQSVQFLVWLFSAVLGNSASPITWIATAASFAWTLALWWVHGSVVRLRNQAREAS